ncbi:unnamed protein product [Oikopleura dioica]|uniref:Uncharacterized protein n=1 Tax=Oikopleura dioica TaxID=34765 RepID=E4WUB6_OIKDI|nr:unnamed protein product [Oikopleura dioica]
MSKKNTHENSQRDLHEGRNTVDEQNRRQLARTSAQFGYIAGAREADDKAVFEQADRDTPLSVGGRIDAWFDRIVSNLPQEQIARLKEQVNHYLFPKDSSGNEKPGLTDGEIIENAKMLIKQVMEKFDTDGDGSPIGNFSLMVFLHKLIATELGKRVSFFNVGKLYLNVFTDIMYQFLTGLTPVEFQKIWDVTLKAAENALTFRKCVMAVVLAYSCMYLYNNYYKK